MSKSLKSKYLTKGQSLFEVLFSIAIASLILIGVVSLSAKSVRNSDYSSNNALATKYNQAASEWIRQYRDASWTDFVSHSTTTPGSNWCANSLPYPPPAWGLPSGCGSGVITGTIFSRTLNLTKDSTDPDLVIVTINVNWNDAQGMHTVQTISYLTNWNRH